MNKLSRESENLYIYMSTFIICTIIAMLEQTGYVNVALAGIIATLSSIVYILIINEPIKALLVLLLGQVFTVIADIYGGIKVGVAVKNSLLPIAFIMVMLLVMVNSAKKNKENKTLKDIVGYKRYMLRAPWWSKIIIYSTFITVISLTSQSKMMEDLGIMQQFRVYSAISVVLPTLQLLTIISLSNLAYEVYVFKIVMDVYTLYNLYDIDKLEVESVLYLVVELCILLYGLSIIAQTNKEKRLDDISSMKDKENNSNKKKTNKEEEKTNNENIKNTKKEDKDGNQ